MPKYKIIEANGEYALTRKRWFKPREYYDSLDMNFHSPHRLAKDIYWSKEKCFLEKIIKRLEAK